MEQRDLFGPPVTPVHIARKRRDRGIVRAAQHAEADSPGWRARALALLNEFMAVHREPFLSEDFVEWARTRITRPPDGRAYGQVMLAAARAGVIRKAGYAPAKTSNLSPKVLWRKNP